MEKGKFYNVMILRMKKNHFESWSAIPHFISSFFFGNLRELESCKLRCDAEVELQPEGIIETEDHVPWSTSKKLPHDQSHLTAS